MNIVDLLPLEMVFLGICFGLVVFGTYSLARSRFMEKSFNMYLKNVSGYIGDRIRNKITNIDIFKINDIYDTMPGYLSRLFKFWCWDKLKIWNKHKYYKEIVEFIEKDSNGS